MAVAEVAVRVSGGERGVTTVVVATGSAAKELATGS